MNGSKYSREPNVMHYYRNQWTFNTVVIVNNGNDRDHYAIFVLTILLAALALHNMAPLIVAVIIRHKYVFAFFVSILIVLGYWKIKQKIEKKLKDNQIKNRLHRMQGTDSIFLGYTKSKTPVYIPLSSRRMHAEVVGTTNAGKTESVLLPWMIDDIKNGRGLILIDGKSDRTLLDKLYAYTVKHNRSKDFRLLSLVNIDASSSINPLLGGTPDEVTERVFAAFNFEDEYYKNLQFEVLKQVLHLFEKANVIPTFSKLIQAITNPVHLQTLSDQAQDRLLEEWVERFIALSKDEREKRTSGLVNQLGHFTSGETATLFNSEEPQIDIEQAMREGLIVYFQLPVLKTPTLGKATAKLVLQCIQSAVSSRHLDQDKKASFFGIFLDDFTEYLIPSFVSLLNKSRSANAGVTFAHQAQGDLGALGEEVKNAIQTNSNLKVFMRTNEPETAEYYSRLIGTKESVKTTERQTKGILGKEKTGEGSIRDVEEFVFHPNVFKRELGTGEAVIVVPFADGNFATQLKFEMQPDLKAQKLPKITKPPVSYLQLEPSNKRNRIKDMVERKA
ncbi:MAG: type IV secretory system conjugative DNA transfer family protein [Pseudobdellovibrionaceae bacterium]